MDIKIIENKLDENIHSYNKYTKNNPMIGVSFDINKNIYILRYETLKLKNKNKKKLCKLLKEHILGDKEGWVKKIICPQHFFIYKNYPFIIYDSIDKPLFDIQHILLLLNLNDISDKYSKFKNKIVMRGFKKNIYGGYIIRELIDEETMFDIILSSNSTFSKKFKKDVAKLLVELRSGGDIVIAEDSIKTTKYINSEPILKDLFTVKEVIYEFSYDNSDAMAYIKNLIDNGQKIPLTKFMNKHVLYMIITELKDPLDKHRIIIKFGYSENIHNRLETLEAEYKCKMHLIGCKVISGESYEKKFHANLVKRHPELHCPIMIDGTKKNELYALDKKLIDEFNEVPDIEGVNSINSEAIDVSKNSAENLKYQIELKDKEIELEKIKMDKIDKEIELLKLQLKLKKINK